MRDGGRAFAGAPTGRGGEGISRLLGCRLLAGG